MGGHGAGDQQAVGEALGGEAAGGGILSFRERWVCYWCFTRGQSYVSTTFWC